eukprot:7098208-Pyramimonas_sp.AAC.1
MYRDTSVAKCGLKQRGRRSLSVNCPAVGSPAVAMAVPLPELMRRTMTAYDNINESLPDTSPHRETLMHIDDQRNYVMYMSRSNLTDRHGYVSYGPNSMMVVQFNCLSGTSQDGGPKLTD